MQELNGTTVLANLLTGLGIDEYFTRTDATGTRSFLTDALGSTLALTDAAGAVQTQYTYDPFGKTTPSGPTSTNTFQYTGRENDGTGLYYYRARYYHPTLHRFVAEDPILAPVTPLVSPFLGACALGGRPAATFPILALGRPDQKVDRTRFPWTLP